MQWIPTAIALVILSACIVCAIQAWSSRKECDAIESSLRRSLGRLAAVEAECDVLAKQLSKLRGKIYRTEQQEPAIEIASAGSTLPACENYLTAQRDGPRSAAAQCGCDYCNAKREERDALRARHVPKTNTERKNAIEKGRH